MNSKNRITEGPILGRLIMFALPIMAVNLLQVFYSSADMMIVALSNEGDAVGAVGTTTSVINLIVNVFIGISIGANICLARNIGAQNEEGARNVVHTAVIFSVIMGFSAAFIGIAAARPVLSLMGTRGSLLELSVRYAAIYFVGVPFLALTNFATALLHGSGDTKTPMIILSVAGAFNVLANLFFVLVCDMSIEGVAIATMLSNLLSAVLLVIKLTRLQAPYRLRMSYLRVNKRALLDVIRIGVPAGLQGALFSISHLVIQSSVLTVNNSLVPQGAPYQPIVKGSSAATSLESFAYTTLSAVSSATITFVSQNHGAGNYARIRRIKWIGYATASTVAMVVAWSALLLKEPLLGFYGINAGAEGSLESLAYEAAVTKMQVLMSFYFLPAVMEIGSGMLQGLSRPLTATAISVCGSVVFRVIWIATVFAAVPTLKIVFLSFPISWVLTAVANFVLGSINLKRLTRAAKEKELQQA